MQRSNIKSVASAAAGQQQQQEKEEEEQQHQRDQSPGQLDDESPRREHGHRDRDPHTSPRGSVLYDAIGGLVNPVVNAMDINGVVQRIDVNDVVSRVDWNAVIDEIDWNNLLNQIDMDALLDRMDVNRLVERVDVNGLVERSNLRNIVARSSKYESLYGVFFSKNKRYYLGFLPLLLIVSFPIISLWNLLNRL